MTTPRTTRAAVTTGIGSIELRELEVPRIGSSEGLLRVEGSGVCGSDVTSFATSGAARVMGHETVGTIAAAGADAAARWGVTEGDRVLLEEYLPCGHCRYCRSAEFRYCLESDSAASADALRYGTTGLDRAPGLWGGFSEYQYLHLRTVLHAVPPGLPTALATLGLPIGNGFEWACRTGEVGPGDSILVFGPGQQGLGCVVAAKAAGAREIIVVGLRRDEDRLAVARRLGATTTLYADDPLVDRVRDITGGDGVDVVVDTATGGADEFRTAAHVVRKGGRIVLPVRRPAPLSDVPLNLVSQKAVSVHGVRGHSFGSVELALQLIADRADELAVMSTMTTGLDGVADAIRATAGADGARTIHATVLPWGSADEPEGTAWAAPAHPQEG
jgi:threonine dehydrogenase-like Zn-dependent dehydrogenase